MSFAFSCHRVFLLLLTGSVALAGCSANHDDAGALDAGNTDAGALDAANADASNTDSGNTEGGTTDGGADADARTCEPYADPSNDPRCPPEYRQGSLPDCVAPGFDCRYPFWGDGAGCEAATAICFCQNRATDGGADWKWACAQ